MGLRVSAVVPARDEADRVAATVRALRRIPGVDEVVVVDDGSRDATAARARAEGARVVRAERPSGKAAALTLGARAARGAILLLADADLGPSAEALAPLCRAVEQGEADLAVAVPCRASGGGLGSVRLLARWGGALLGGSPLSAPLSGQRAMRAEHAPLLLGGPARGFGAEVQMNVRAGRAGLRIAERRLPFTHRVTGMDPRGWWHRARQFRDVALTLLHLAMERRGRAGGGPGRG